MDTRKMVLKLSLSLGAIIVWLLYNFFMQRWAGVFGVLDIRHWKEISQLSALDFVYGIIDTGVLIFTLVIIWR